MHEEISLGKKHSIESYIDNMGKRGICKGNESLASPTSGGRASSLHK
jgi:hypothetical protein